MLLSELGRLYLPYAQSICREQGGFEQVLSNFKRRMASSFAIGTVHNLQYYSVPFYLIGFRRQHPDCIINAMECEDKELYALFESRQINLITVIVPTNEQPEFSFIPAAESRIAAVLPHSHPKANAEYIDLRELAGESLLLPDRCSMFSRLIRNQLRALDIESNIIYEGTSLGCVDFALSGMGICLQAEELLRNHPDKGLHPVPLKPDITYRYGLGYRDKGLSTWEKEFVKFMEQYSIAPAES